jgi:hypothetical protein
MPNPALATASSLAIDTLFDGDATRGLKRGYGHDAITGATDEGKHQGVASVPAAVSAVDQHAAAEAVAALPAVASKRNYLSGFAISGGGATAASVVRATITGIGVTWGIDIGVPAGVDLAIAPIIISLPNPIPASAVNTAITLTVPSFGSGNTDVSVAIWGYVSA